MKRSLEFTNPKIVFVTWDTCLELTQRFKIKFENIKRENPHFAQQGSMDVLTLKEVCKELKYVKHELNSNVDILNNVCKKLKGKYSSIF